MEIHVNFLQAKAVYMENAGVSLRMEAGNTSSQDSELEGATDGNVLGTPPPLWN